LSLCVVRCQSAYNRRQVDALVLLHVLGVALAKLRVVLQVVVGLHKQIRNDQRAERELT
jgi:hypothetical protein